MMDTTRLAMGIVLGLAIGCGSTGDDAAEPPPGPCDEQCVVVASACDAVTAPCSGSESRWRAFFETPGAELRTRPPLLSRIAERRVEEPSIAAQLKPTVAALPDFGTCADVIEDCQAQGSDELLTCPADRESTLTYDEAEGAYVGQSLTVTFDVEDEACLDTSNRGDGVSYLVDTQRAPGGRDGAGRLQAEVRRIQDRSGDLIVHLRLAAEGLPVYELEVGGLTVTLTQTAENEYVAQVPGEGTVVVTSAVAARLTPDDPYFVQLCLAESAPTTVEDALASHAELLVYRVTADCL